MNMTLFSLPFLLLMLIAYALYYLLPRRFQWCVLLGTSAVFFYSMGGLRACVVLAASILVSWAGALRMGRLAGRQKSELARTGEDGAALSREEKKAVKEAYRKKRQRTLVFSLIICFTILFVPKFGAFTVRNLNAVAGAFHIGHALAVPDILLPLGISFYTFQLTGYLIDVYKERTEAEGNLFRYALFASYFPQMIQGPISKHSQLAPQLFTPHEYDETAFREGLLRLLWGYFKKMVICANVSVLSNEIIGQFDAKGYAGFTVFTGVLLYGVQMYADFSGGIDIIMGISELFGIRLTENFRSPYMATTISDFWQRWHISLGHWMRDYLFYPIALSKPFSRMARRMKKRIGPYYGKIMPATIASFVIFLLVGLWHGASWRYVAFGLYQATFTSLDSVFERTAEKTRGVLRIDGASFSWRLFQILRTAALVTVGRYFDCAASLRTALRMLKATFTTFNPTVFLDGSFLQMGLDPGTFRFTMLLIVFLIAVDVFNEKGLVFRELFAKQGIVFRWMVYLTAIFAVLVFGAWGPGYNAAAFIYQQI
ncbi:MAG: MBOAT family protein [Clostridiales bacterium]|nr:MBOAT family protein [Clostridiales bacterium]